MRSPGTFDLSFILPRSMFWLADGHVTFEGSPKLPNGSHGEISGGLLRLQGASREAVFNDAAALLTASPRHKRPLGLSAILHTPARPSGFDRWQIIVGAPVAFAAGGIDPYFPPPRA